MKNVNKRTKNNKIRALFVIAAVAVIGLIAVAITNAASSTPTVYFVPASGTYTVGSLVKVAIRENSDAVPINAAQVGFTYPSQLLQLQTISTTNSPFSTNLSPVTQNVGSILITETSLSGGVTGDQLIGEVTFKVLAPGTANLTLNSSCQQSAAAANCTGLSSNGATVASNAQDASFSLQKLHGKGRK